MDFWNLIGPLYCFHRIKRIQNLHLTYEYGATSSASKKYFIFWHPKILRDSLSNLVKSLVGTTNCQHVLV